MSALLGGLRDCWRGQPSNKYDILESGRRIGTVHSPELAAQIVADIARRDARAAADWATAGERR